MSRAVSGDLELQDVDTTGPRVQRAMRSQQHDGWHSSSPGRLALDCGPGDPTPGEGSPETPGGSAARVDASPAPARNILGALTAGQKQITPVNASFRIDGPIAVPELLLSRTAVPGRWASPAGFEPKNKRFCFH
jgi:hypothetical protein